MSWSNQNGALPKWHVEFTSKNFGEPQLERDYRLSKPNVDHGTTWQGQFSDRKMRGFYQCVPSWLKTPALKWLCPNWLSILKSNGSYWFILVQRSHLSFTNPRIPPHQRIFTSQSLLWWRWKWWGVSRWSDLQPSRHSSTGAEECRVVASDSC